MLGVDMSFGSARNVIAAAQQFCLCKTTIDIVPKYTLFSILSYCFQSIFEFRIENTTCWTISFVRFG